MRTCFENRNLPRNIIRFPPNRRNQLKILCNSKKTTHLRNHLITYMQLKHHHRKCRNHTVLSMFLTPVPSPTAAEIEPNNREMHGQLERIQIPIFSGNKMDFQRWNTAFTSCVDMTSLSPHFKMLRLEACLAGEAANTIKGLGYSLEAYETAKTRLFRKYGGS